MAFRRLHGGSSWLPLATKGGNSFVGRVAEVYLLVLLNRLQAALKLYVAKVDDLSVAQEGISIINGYKVGADRVILMGAFKDDYIWRPSNLHLAKLRYCQAQFCKLPDSFGKVMALHCVRLALELLPNDPVLLKERNLILAL
jgi:hypothetical protein